MLFLDLNKKNEKSETLAVNQMQPSVNCESTVYI
jgi:hypothetical protein